MSFVVGVVLSVGLQLALGWWLDSWPRVALARAAVFLAALGVCSHPGAAVGLWLGVVAGMMAVLVGSGAGTLWSMVIATAAASTAAAAAAGSGMRRLVVGLRQ